MAVVGIQRRAPIDRLPAGIRANARDLLLVSGITLLALALRLLPLGSHPRAMSGDEGTFAMEAMAFIRGDLKNPFTAGLMGHPNFTFATIAMGMQVAGETVAGSRVWAAVIGALAIIPTFMLARKFFGPMVAYVSILLLATSHFALFFGRNTMNNVAPFLFAPLSIYLLDEGFIERRKLPALLAGFSLGLSLLYYQASRVMLPVAVLYGLYAVVWRQPLTIDALRRSAFAVAQYAGLTLAGFLTSAMPLLSHWSHHPGSFNSRVNQVSAFASGWLDQEVELTGRNPFEILADQFYQASVTPFRRALGQTLLHYDFPLLSWPVVIPAGIGVAVVTVAFWRRSHFGIAALLWGTSAGTAITIGPGEPHKIVTSTAILAILTAAGIVTLASVFKRILPVRLLVPLAVGVATLVIVSWNLAYFFGDPDRYVDFSDPTTQSAQRIGETAASLGPGATIYLLGLPWMSYAGVSNLQFIAPNATGVDVEPSLEPGEPAPLLTGPTLFAVLPGRYDELNVIRGWFPEGVETLHTWPEWNHSMTTYVVTPS